MLKDDDDGETKQKQTEQQQKKELLERVAENGTAKRQKEQSKSGTFCGKFR